MLLPIILLGGETLAGAALAYGTLPDLAWYSHGLGLIMLMRRIQWLLVLASVLPCLALLGLVISAHLRAYWLFGLLPVLAFFVRSYAPGYRSTFAVAENPLFAAAAAPASTGMPAADDFVIAVTCQNQSYALPFAQLFERPVIAIGEQTGPRLLVMWSVTANRAVAAVLSRNAHARDFEIVASPADSLLLLDRRTDTFIAGLTASALTKSDARAPEFSEILPTLKTTYAQFLADHPDGRVLIGFDNTMLTPAPGAPRVPVLPLLHFRLPDGSAPTAPDPISVICTAAPIGFPSTLDLFTPLNTTAAGFEFLLLRNARARRCRAFDRTIKPDTILSFTIHHDRHQPEVFMLDSQTQSQWTAAGHCIAGRLKGTHLKEYPVDENLYLPVMRYWLPNLELIGK